VPGFARADCHGDGTPIRPGPSGRKAAADVPQACRCTRTSPLICARRSSAVSGSREPACPHAGRLPGGTASTWTHWPGPARTASWPARRRMRRPKFAHESAVGLLRPGGAGQSAAGSGRRPVNPAGLYRPHNLACRPDAVRRPARASRRRRRRCRSRGPRQSGGPGSHESRRYGASAAQLLANGIAASSAPKSRPAGRVTFRVCDAAIAQPAQSFTQTAHGCWPPAARKSAKRAESPLTFAS